MDTGLCLLFSLLVSPVTAAVVINEFLPNPSGPSSEDTEWIELYNSDSAPMDITGWTLDDEEGGTSPYTIASGSSIPAAGFLVFEKSQTGIGLNNSGDSVRLFDASNSLKDSYTYTSASDNISIGRTSDGGGSWVVCLAATKGASNNCSSPIATSAPTNTPTKTPTKTPTPISVFTSTPTPAQIVTKTPTPTIKKSSPPSTPAIAEEVLGDMSTPTETPVATAAGAKTTKPIIVSLLFVGAGLGLLSGVFIWQKRNALMEHDVSY